MPRCRPIGSTRHPCTSHWHTRRPPRTPRLPQVGTARRRRRSSVRCTSPHPLPGRPENSSQRFQTGCTPCTGCRRPCRSRPSPRTLRSGTRPVQCTLFLPSTGRHPRRCTPERRDRYLHRPHPSRRCTSPHLPRGCRPGKVRCSRRRNRRRPHNAPKHNRMRPSRWPRARGRSSRRLCRHPTAGSRPHSVRCRNPLPERRGCPEPASAPRRRWSTRRRRARMSQARRSEPIAVASSGPLFVLAARSYQVYPAPNHSALARPIASPALPSP